MFGPTIRNCSKLGKSNAGCVVKDFKRYLNSAQVSTALRPFYFSVHPDLFGQYPTEREVNENSLKTLSGYLETVQQQRAVNPVVLQFYLKPDRSGKDGSRLKSVKVTLSDRSVRRTVLSLLESCNLPTAHLKEEQSHSTQHRRVPTAADLQKFRESLSKRQAEFYDNDPVIGSFMRRVMKKSEDEDHLFAWLRKNIETAREYEAACQPIRKEIDRLKTELCRELELKEIKWDSGWNISHFRGALESFLALYKHHPTVMTSLKGKTLIFGSDTGVNLEGDVMLNCGEVRHNWLDVLRNVHHQDEVLLRLPAFKRAVSKVLRDIRVTHRKFQPKVMAQSYEAQLRRLTTSLSDYQGRPGYPRHWPSSLSEFELVVETEAGPLMLSPTGQFIVPSSCPPFLLVNFIDEHMDEARRLLDEYNTNKHVEDRLVAEVTSLFGLSDLRKDDNITPTLMIQCCEHLLKNFAVLQPFLTDSHIFITTYYSLLTDGQLCFPWNWKP